MKQLLGNLISKLRVHVGNALVGLTYVQTMGILPVEAYNFFASSQPKQEEARLMMGVARLKEDG